LRIKAEIWVPPRRADMQFLKFGAHVICARVQHAPSHPFPCALPCAAEGPQSASLLSRYCSLSLAPLHLLHSQEGTLTRAWPSSCRCHRFSKVASVGDPLARKCERLHCPQPPAASTSLLAFNRRFFKGIESLCCQ
jgi:hypothetical protein